MNDNNLDNNALQNSDTLNSQDVKPIQDVNNNISDNASKDDSLESIVESNAPVAQSDSNGVVIQNTDNIQQNNTFQNPNSQLNSIPNNSDINSVNVNQQLNNIQQNTPNPVGENKKNNLPIILGACVFAFLIVIIGGFIILTNKKTVVKNEVSSVFNVARKSLKNLEDNTLIYSLNDEKVGMSGSLSVKSDYKNESFDLTGLEKYKITYNGVLSKKDNEASLSFKLANDSDIINSKLYAKGKKVFINLGDIFEKTIVSDIDKEIKDIEINDVNIKDYDLLLAKTEKIIKNNIDDKDITKSQEEKEFKGKRKKYSKVSYKVNINKLTKAVLNGYKEDKEVVKLLSKMLDLDENDVVKNLEEQIKDIRDTNEEDFILNVYLDGIFNTTCGVEIVDDNSSIVADVKGSIYTYRLLSNDKEIGNGILDLENNKLTYTSKTEYETFNFDIDWNKENTISGTIKLTGKDMNYNFDFNINNKVNDKSMNTNFNGKFNSEVSGEKFNFEINGDYSIIKDAKVESFDTSNAISSNELNDTDSTKIYDNFMNKFKPILNEISPSLGNSLDMNSLSNVDSDYDTEIDPQSFFRKLF